MYEMRAKVDITRNQANLHSRGGGGGSGGSGGAAAARGGLGEAGCPSRFQIYFGPATPHQQWSGHHCLWRPTVALD